MPASSFVDLEFRGRIRSLPPSGDEVTRTTKTRPWWRWSARLTTRTCPRRSRRARRTSRHQRKQHGLEPVWHGHVREVLVGERSRTPTPDLDRLRAARNARSAVQRAGDSSWSDAPGRGGGSPRTCSERMESCSHPDGMSCKYRTDQRSTVHRRGQAIRAGRPILANARLMMNGNGGNPATASPH